MSGPGFPYFDYYTYLLFTHPHRYSQPGYLTRSHYHHHYQNQNPQTVYFSFYFITIRPLGYYYYLCFLQSDFSSSHPGQVNIYYCIPYSICSNSITELRVI